MNILAFAATNSRESINKDLIHYASTLLSEHHVEILDINDYDMPIYSIDMETETGIPAAANRFLEKISKADALLISFAEHNGNYTVAYKNIFDWVSRANRDVYQGKPVIMLATSPGEGGAQSVLKLATESVQFFDGNLLASLSVPSFYENFDASEKTIINPEIVDKFENTLSLFSHA